MTQDEIIEMARQAGFFVWTDEQKTIEGYGEDLERFAKLVVAKEREACAKVCEDFEVPDQVLGAHPDYLEGKRMAAYQCSIAIRARGEA